MARNADELRAWGTGRIPSFVVRDARPSAIPVFTFHDVTPQGFERQLLYLRDNGYRTVGADEAADPGLPEGRVALTFDDATWSFWAYAFPLLRRYGQRAILFVVPGVVRDGAAVRPNLEDVWAGRCTSGDAAEAGRSDPFCTWIEIGRMYASGCVDVHSHSLSHARVPVTPRVIDFIHPGFDGYAGGFDIPLSVADPDEEGRRSPPPGTPVFESASRLSSRLRFREDPRLVSDARAAVKEHGPSFFQHPDWRTVLAAIVNRIPPSERGSYEDETSREAAIRHELVESKRRIEARLDGHPVTHLALPWHVGSDLAERLAAEAGYRFVHGGAATAAGRSGTSLTSVRRLPDRYLLRLPGRGRVSLKAALATGRRVWR